MMTMERTKVISASLGAKGEVVLTFPYNESLVQQVKTMLGVKWSKPRTAWLIPAISFAFYAYDPNFNFKMTKEVKARVDHLLLNMLASEKIKNDPNFLEKGLPYLDAFVHQQHGVAWILSGLRTLGGLLLADDVGLGKTVQTIASIILMGDLEKTLVLCEGSDRPNWEREVATFGPDLPVVVIKGTPEQRAKQWQSFESGVAIASHDILIRDAIPKQWDLIVRDEATAFKNPSAARSKAVKKLQTKYKLDLTATPIENSLLDMRSIMDWLQPGLLGNEFQFKQKFTILDFFGQIRSYKNQDEAKVRYSAFFFRRTDDLLDLPERLPTVSKYIELSAKEQGEYGRLSYDLKEWAQLTNATGLEMEGGVMKLRQFVSDPRNLDPAAEPGAKFLYFKHLAKELADAGHKTIVFTFFVPTAEMLAKELNAPLVKGGMSHEEKDRIVQEFNFSDAPLLVATGAIKKGKNIAGADTVVHFDALYNPALHKQRFGRVRRIHQKRPQREYNLIVTGTVDERIYSILHRKAALADEMIDNPNLQETKLTRMDMLSLL